MTFANPIVNALTVGKGKVVTVNGPENENIFRRLVVLYIICIRPRAFPTGLITR